MSETGLARTRVKVALAVIVALAFGPLVFHGADIAHIILTDVLQPVWQFFTAIPRWITGALRAIGI